MKKNLAHLPVPLTYIGSPKPGRNVGTPETEIFNKTNRTSHSKYLVDAGQVASNYWSGMIRERKNLELPELPKSIPLLLRLEPGSNIDYLRSAFSFEIVAEHEDGIVIICSDDMDLDKFLEKAADFKIAKTGSGNSAKIYEVFGPENHDVRLKNILEAELYTKWSDIDDSLEYIVDVSIECLGIIKLPNIPKRTNKDTDDKYSKKYLKWEEKRNQLLQELDDLQIKREEGIHDFITSYNAEILSIFQDEPDISILPDSFTTRIKISGLGLKDIALNYPYVFEICEPEDIESNNSFDIEDVQSTLEIEFEEPNENSPFVCVIDSGIQENHKLLEKAVDSGSSYCFIPGQNTTDIADYVVNGGHGTRIAGAILYGELIPETGHVKLPYWIRNARVLDADNSLHENMLPSKLLNSIVNKFTQETSPSTKIFNHSINSSVPCKTSRMSSWAAEIDYLSWTNDVLFIQSAGNVNSSSDILGIPGISQHLEADRIYPDYLLESSCRIANPAQSMQALTVGSVSYEYFNDGFKETFALKDQPSSFSRSGFGMWGTIKPDVVEYGGDFAFDSGNPPQISILPDAAPELVRSTLGTTGPELGRDNVGTSFSTPKVSRIAAHLENDFPSEPALLYRSLIANSARWPDWAEESEDKTSVIRQIGYGIPSLDRACHSEDKCVTLITPGVNIIGDREGHIYRIPIPEEFRAPGADFNVRIDVSLSYVSPTRRTRRHKRNYFGTWLEWKSSKNGESFNSLKSRLFKDQENDVEDGEATIPWKLRERSDWGEIQGASRSVGSLQKDWAVLPAHDLPIDFCLAVIGHAGWDINSDFKAKYSLVMTIEATDTELPLYELIQAELESLVDIQT